MRYRPEHKQETHQRLLKVAADAIRVEGPHQVGVAAIMARAGLTHGGFYAHFASKDELVAQAIHYMFEESDKHFLARTAELGAADALSAYIHGYLSTRHRDAESGGCPIAALLSDVPRVCESAQQNFSAGVDQTRQRLSSLLAQLGMANPREEADQLLAALAGALMFARAEPERNRSDEYLVQSRKALLGRLNLALTKGSTTSAKSPLRKHKV